uniref:Uncharacterized protein n=1 Tax=Noctiluca scintillans TaxID=2966 RepID=A0A7S1AI72_NOCSC|mmetsp:Transcript_47260/g.125494  ORF Transcript_47260/g.125494 Transcript_47260/m.125494 type:complete len:129 (+) Transcript_47260:48-434(+)
MQDDAGCELHGFWKSANGECHIFKDKCTNQLTYEELIGDGSERLHGRLVDVSTDENGVACWQAALMVLEKNQGPWYGPSCGEKPDDVGDIVVRLLRGPPRQLETRIREEGEKEWQPPTLFELVSESKA